MNKNFEKNNTGGHLPKKNRAPRAPGLWALFLACAPAAHALELLPAQMEKVNWESRQLTAVDVNGDGLTDLATINGVERSIDLLIQKKEPGLEPSKAKEIAPPMTLSRYRRERIPTEAAPNAFVFGNFSGKAGGQGLEVAYTAKRLGIVFMQRNAEGRWVETHRIADVETQPFTHVLWAGQLQKNAPTSLLALVKGRLLIIQDYKVVQSYGTTYEDSGYLVVNDINGDGRMDVSYDYETPNGLGVRLQDSAGRFDAEGLFGYASESEKNFGNRGDHFFFFGGNTSFVEERKIAPTQLKPQVMIYGTQTERAAAVQVDVDASGRPGLLLADSKGAELILYRTKDGRWQSPERYPSLKGVTQLITLQDGKKAPVVALFSPDERAVALASWDRDSSRIGFPALVELADEPVGLFGLEGRAWVIVKNDKEFALQEIYADGRVGERMKIEGLKRAPDLSLALRQEGGLLLAFFQNRDAASFAWLTGKGLTAVKVPSALMRANFTAVDAGRVGKGALNGGQTEDLIISQRSTLRLYKFDGKELKLSDQVLPLAGEANLKLPFVRQGVLWAFNARAGAWLKFERDEASKLWKNTQQVEATALEADTVLPTQEGLLAVGRRAFYTLNPSAPGLSFTPVKRWESSLKVDGFNWASLESFDAAKTPAAVLFSQSKRMLEIVELGETPRSLLNFEVYKKDAHFDGRKGEEVEPRELITADVTGDGKSDLVLLIHNKVLVYPQK